MKNNSFLNRCLASFLAFLLLTPQTSFALETWFVQPTDSEASKQVRQARDEKVFTAYAAQDEVRAVFESLTLLHDLEEKIRASFGKTKAEVARDVDGKLAEVAFDTDPNNSNRLGWSVEKLKWLTETPEGVASVDQVLTDGATIRKQYKHVIFAGMGGSGLSVEFVKGTYDYDSDTHIFSLRTTDPEVIKDLLENQIAGRYHNGNLKEAMENTLIIPVSKSGTTQETISHKDYFTELYQELNIPLEEHMWVITDTGSPLDTGDFEQRNIQLNRRGDIGGRFTAPATNVFLLPLAILRPEILEEILLRAVTMNDHPEINDDPYLNLAAFLKTQASDYGRDKLTLLVGKRSDKPMLKDFPIWVEQLIEESLGKDGKGITLIYDEDLTPEHLKSVEENDRVFLRINPGAGIKVEPELWDYLKKNKYPTFELNLSYYWSLKDIGGLMLGFQRMVAAMAYLWDINFVNQPGVEGYKKATRAVLGELAEGEDVTVPESWQYTEFNSLRLYYDRLIEAGIMTMDEIEKEVSLLGESLENAPAVYAAVINLLLKRGKFEVAELMSYGKMGPEIEGVMTEARASIFTHGLKMPSKLGEGPDKNHSFHQNIDDGKDMFFSTYLMPLHFQQPDVVSYSDNPIRAQTIGTIDSIVKARRSVVAIGETAKDKSVTAQDLKEFFEQVRSYLPTTRPESRPFFILGKRLSAAMDSGEIEPQGIVREWYEEFERDILDAQPLLNQPDGVKAYERNVVYKDPKGRFSMLNHIFAPGRGTPIHLHGNDEEGHSSGVVLALGHIREYEYEIKSKNLSTGRFDLRETGVHDIERGDVVAVPESERPHLVMNPSKKPVGLIEIYFGSFTRTARFIPPNGDTVGFQKDEVLNEELSYGLLDLARVQEWRRLIDDEVGDFLGEQGNAYSVYSSRGYYVDEWQREFENAKIDLEQPGENAVIFVDDASKRIVIVRDRIDILRETLAELSERAIRNELDDGTNGWMSAIPALRAMIDHLVDNMGDIDQMLNILKDISLDLNEKTLDDYHHMEDKPHLQATYYVLYPLAGAISYLEGTFRGNVANMGKRDVSRKFDNFALDLSTKTMIRSVVLQRDFGATIRYIDGLKGKYQDLSRHFGVLVDSVYDRAVEGIEKKKHAERNLLFSAAA